MKNTCVIVIGLGSMGKRRIRLIQKYDSTIKIVGIDLNSKRQLEVKEEWGIETADSIGDAVQKYEPSCAFVCTSPLSHSGIISECLDHHLNVFTELNLVSDKYNENMEKAKRKNLKIFLSSSLQYREEIKYIKKKVGELQEKVSYSYHVGQYLPDWHPWENYQDFFVGNPKTNGCREILAIDLPWLIAVFGDITNIMVQKSKNTALEISYSDSYQILLQHENGTQGMFAVDVVSRKAVRNLEIYSEHFYLEWDGSPYGLKTYQMETRQMETMELYQQIDKNTQYSALIIENMYLSEIKAFFDYIYKGEEPLYSMEEDRKVLEMIDQIEG